MSLGQLLSLRREKRPNLGHMCLTEVGYGYHRVIEPRVRQPLEPRGGFLGANVLEAFRQS